MNGVKTQSLNWECRRTVSSLTRKKNHLFLLNYKTIHSYSFESEAAEFAIATLWDRLGHAQGHPHLHWFKVLFVNGSTHHVVSSSLEVVKEVNSFLPWQRKCLIYPLQAQSLKETCM